MEMRGRGFSGNPIPEPRFVRGGRGNPIPEPRLIVGRSGRGNPIRPPRLIVAPVYEQFKPRSEWRQEDDHNTLLVHLPRFQKEYIKVTTEDLNTVRVRGQRLVTKNKWKRFQEDFQVPENCEMRGIRARFNGGILTITMPRKIINTPPPPTTTTTTTRIPPETEEQPSRRPKQEEALPKPKEEPKEKKPDTPQRSPLDDNTLPPQSQPILTSSTTPIKQESITPAPEAKKINDDITFGSLPTSVPKKDTNNVVENPNVAKKKDLDEEKRIEALLKEITKRNFERKKRQLSDAHTGFQGGENKNVLARKGRVNEDRKVLMNVGVGVLVIVALGVHVSNTIGLMGKGK